MKIRIAKLCSDVVSDVHSHAIPDQGQDNLVYPYFTVGMHGLKLRA